MTWVYVGFIAFILVMLVLDLKVVNREAHEIRPRESLIFTGITVLLALLFAGCIYMMYQNDWPAGITETLKTTLKRDGPRAEAQIGPLGFGFEAATTYLTAWVLEYALSVDNLFVIAVIFGYFKVPARLQHRVLFWGVLGALLMRGGMIAAGTKAVQQFHWLEYVFGAFLVYTAYKMLRAGEDQHDPSSSLPVRIARRMLPLTPDLHGEKFFVRIDGKRFMTPLFLVLLTVEFTDVVFAVDSIPAAIGLTSDPFLVFTSNIFAILGLRSLYFAVAAALGSFRYLKVSLVFVLAFIGLKMLARPWVDISPLVSLAVVLGMLLAGGLASVFATAKEREQKRTPIEDLAGAVEASRRNLKRVLILIAGSTVILLGIAIAPLPGPGPVVLIPVGLAILGTEFVWAQRLQRKVKQQTQMLTNAADQVAAKSSPWVVPPVVLFVGAGVIFLAHHGPFPAKYVYTGSIGLWIPIFYWAWKTVAASRRGSVSKVETSVGVESAHSDTTAHRLNKPSDRAVNRPPAA
jgi:tellurite resistance protein TerC